MNTNLPDLPILTERLCLREFAADDFRAYAEYHRRRDVYRFLYAPVPDEAALKERFSGVVSAGFSDEGDTLRLAVCSRNEDAMIGEVKLEIANKPAGQAEVGYIFNPILSGKGYATEATRGMLALGFGHLDCHRIFARMDAQNAGSVGVVERLGMRKEAHLIENDLRDGVWGDECIYAMLRTEWEGR